MTPEQQILFDALTPLQKRVATNVLAGMTQRHAYIEAGGKGATETVIDSSASEILRNPQVKAFTDSMQKQAVSDAIMTREEAMKELSAIGRGRLVDIVKFKTATIGKDLETGDDVNQTVWEIDESLQETDPDKLIIISELEVGKFGPKIKTHSKVAAIAQLAKMQGWESAAKHEISGPNGGPIRTAAELSDEALEMLALGALTASVGGEADE